MLLSFSQAGCRAFEDAARSGRRLRGVFGFLTGLVGTADPGNLPVAELYGHSPKRFEYTA